MTPSQFRKCLAALGLNPGRTVINNSHLAVERDAEWDDLVDQGLAERNAVPIMNGNGAGGIVAIPGFCYSLRETALPLLRAEIDIICEHVKFSFPRDVVPLPP